MIEAMQEWRISSKSPEPSLASLKPVASIAANIVKGCVAVKRPFEIGPLCAMFTPFLTLESDRQCFAVSVADTMSQFNVAVPASPHAAAVSTPPAAPTASLEDDAASRVLDYVCATGHLPEDDAPPSIPLFTLFPDYFPQRAFDTLRDAVLQHPKLLEKGSESLGSGFALTKGFIFRFSNAGVPTLRAHPHATCLLPFFDAARSPASNAFVLNVLCCCPDDDDTKYAVGWHKDATLSLREGAGVAGIPYRLAQTVTVLYLSLPADFDGGELDLRDPETKEVHSVSPECNTCCVFSGDAEHAVRTFRGSGNRISLVLEQYEVPVGEVNWLQDFECVNQSDYMTIRL
jgi:hypothetical protein